MRTITPAGIRLIKSFELCRLVVYLDSDGNPTAGWGHLVLPEDNLKVGDAVTQEWADSTFLSDLVPPQLAVVHYSGQSLNDAQFSALVDFAYNDGVGSFQEFANKHMRGPDWQFAVPQALPLWIDAGGKPLSGLLQRRIAEAAMFCGLQVSR